MKYYLLILFSIVAFFSCKNEEDPQVAAIQLDVNELELKVGETHDFKVSYTPAEASSPSYEWNIYAGYNSAKGIAEISQNGTLKALGAGRIDVVVKTTDVFDSVTGEPFKAECSVEIKPVKAESIKLSKTTLTLDPGSSENLTCSFVPENTTNQKTTWQSSNNKIIKVVADPANPLTARIDAVAAGEATVTVYNNSSTLKAECKVKVNIAKVEGLAFKETVKTIMQGDEVVLEPVFTPEYATNKNIKWSSSDETIATVDNNGKVSGRHFGECLIKAVSEEGGFEATCKIIVKPLPVEGIKFSAPNYQVEIGGEKQLEVVFMPENASNKKLTWSCSNPRVISLDQNGKVKGYTSGTSLVTAMSEDGGYTATCEVSVVEIDKLMNVYFPSAAVTIINGYYIGSIYCSIRNNSSHSVRLTKFSIVETSNYYIVAETTDPSLLGTLSPGQTITLGGRLNSIYDPIFQWEFEYNGKTYSTYTKYGDNFFLSQPVNPVSKAENLIPLSRVN